MFDRPSIVTSVSGPSPPPGGEAVVRRLVAHAHLRVLQAFVTTMACLTPKAAWALTCAEVRQLIDVHVPESIVVSTIENAAPGLTKAAVTCLVDAGVTGAVAAAAMKSAGVVPQAAEPPPSCRPARDFLTAPGTRTTIRGNGRFGVTTEVRTVKPGTAKDVVVVRADGTTKNLMDETVTATSFDGFQIDVEGNVWLVMQAALGQDGHNLDPPVLVLDNNYCRNTPPSMVTVNAVGSTRECVVLTSDSGWLDYFCLGLGWVASKNNTGAWAFELLAVSSK
jgi:hypothetical protein